MVALGDGIDAPQWGAVVEVLVDVPVAGNPKGLGVSVEVESARFRKQGQGVRLQGKAVAEGKSFIGHMESEGHGAGLAFKRVGALVALVMHLAPLAPGEFVGIVDRLGRLARIGQSAPDRKWNLGAFKLQVQR